MGLGRSDKSAMKTNEASDLLSAREGLLRYSIGAGKQIPSSEGHSGGVVLTTGKTRDGLTGTARLHARRSQFEGLLSSFAYGAQSFGTEGRRMWSNRQAEELGIEAETESAGEAKLNAEPLRDLYSLA